MLFVRHVPLRTKLFSFLPMPLPIAERSREQISSLVALKSVHLSKGHYISFPTRTRKCLSNPSIPTSSRMPNTPTRSGRTWRGRFHFFPDSDFPSVRLRHSIILCISQAILGQRQPSTQACLPPVKEIRERDKNEKHITCTYYCHKADRKYDYMCIERTGKSCVEEEKKNSR